MFSTSGTQSHLWTFLCSTKISMFRFRIYSSKKSFRTLHIGFKLTYGFLISFWDQNIKSLGIFRGQSKKKCMTRIFFDDQSLHFFLIWIKNTEYKLQISIHGYPFDHLRELQMIQVCWFLKKSKLELFFFVEK